MIPRERLDLGAQFAGQDGPGVPHVGDLEHAADDKHHQRARPRALDVVLREGRVVDRVVADVLRHVEEGAFAEGEALRAAVLGVEGERRLADDVLVQVVPQLVCAETAAVAVVDSEV